MAWDVAKRKNGVTRRAWRVQVHVLQAPNIEQVQAYIAGHEFIKGPGAPPLWSFEESVDVFGHARAPSYDKVFRISDQQSHQVTSWGRRRLQGWAQQCHQDYPNAQVLFTAFSSTALHSTPTTEAAACWMTLPGQSPAVVGANLDEESLRALGLLPGHLNESIHPSGLGLKFARQSLIPSAEVFAFHLRAVQAWSRSQVLEEGLLPSVESPALRKPRM